MILRQVVLAGSVCSAGFFLFWGLWGTTVQPLLTIQAKSYAPELAGIASQVEEENHDSPSKAQQHAHDEKSTTKEPVREPQPGHCMPSADWRHLRCSAEEPPAAAGDRPEARNALDDQQYKHSPIFLQYRPFTGAPRTAEGLLVDFMGLVIPKHLFCNEAYMSQPQAHALRVRQCPIYDEVAKMKPPPQLHLRWPVISEEYFEYVDVLGAVSEYAEGMSKAATGRKFVFVEIGAGYGHWTFTAHRALLQKVPEASYKYVMVDVLGDLRSEIMNMAELNGVRTTTGPDSPMHFHCGYIGAQGAGFERGQRNDYFRLWGLQGKKNETPSPPIDLKTLLEVYDVPCEIDMVDIDIQTSEYVLFSDSSVLELLTARVRRAHIGTHGGNDEMIKHTFEAHGWRSVWDFAASQIRTQLGPVEFGDGVQSFVNTGRLSCGAKAAATEGAIGTVPPATPSCTVSSDWNTLACQDPQLAPEAEDKARNALDNRDHKHLSSFLRYKPYSGTPMVTDGLMVDFMGLVIPKRLFCNKAYMGQPRAHALRVRQCNIYDKVAAMQPTPKIQLRWPVISEEYFEYADVLDAVTAYGEDVAGKSGGVRKFVFVEIGAGYGHWTFTAHRALLQKVPQAEYKYVMVDVLGDLRGEIMNLARLNGITSTPGPESPMHFHCGYVGAQGKGFEKNTRSDYFRMWGLQGRKNRTPSAPISIQELFEIYEVPCEIDMVDIDIQTSEYILFSSPAVIELLTSRVRRVHIGTHGKNDTLIRDVFSTHGWTKTWDFPAKGFETKLGPVQFGDGVLSFVNQKEKLSCE
mmetsp:Transcript_82713/g.267826  ORF Transcript_82713/g.267826 Transcript_82713/m.267826 type:complete len:801 (-) Transcript_82713:377-2779(-)